MASAAAQGQPIPLAPSAAVTASGAPPSASPFSSRGMAPPSAGACPSNHLIISHQDFSHLTRGAFSAKMPANAFGHWSNGSECLGAVSQFSPEALKACTGGINRPCWLPAPAEAADLHQAVTAGVQAVGCAGIVLLQAGSDVVVSFKKAKDRGESHGSGSVTDISGKPMADAAWLPRDHAFPSWQP